MTIGQIRVVWLIIHGQPVHCNFVDGKLVARDWVLGIDQSNQVGAVCQDHIIAALGDHRINGVIHPADRVCDSLAVGSIWI